jgi:hypothetical protein
MVRRPSAAYEQALLYMAGSAVHDGDWTPRLVGLCGEAHELTEVCGCGVSGHAPEIVEDAVGPGVVGLLPLDDGQKVRLGEWSLYGHQHASSSIVALVPDRHVKSLLCNVDDRRSHFVPL